MMDNPQQMKPTLALNSINTKVMGLRLKFAFTISKYFPLQKFSTVPEELSRGKINKNTEHETCQLIIWLVLTEQQLKNWFKHVNMCSLFYFFKQHVAR